MSDETKIGIVIAIGAVLSLGAALGGAVGLIVVGLLILAAWSSMAAQA